MKQFKEELNQEQQNVFEQICIGNNKDHSKEIVKYLQDLGFVEIKDYYPYPTKEIYEQWQNWCRTFDINDIQTDNYGNFYFANNSNNKQKSLYISEEEDLIS
ncbi:hypothetical protein KY334_07155, partial [Candidatus Woesearchaeota archaeon]|nr:hypothetical protein [Candidatus Woesearchaeota archaeon]